MVNNLLSDEYDSPSDAQREIDEDDSSISPADRDEPHYDVTDEQGDRCICITEDDAGSTADSGLTIGMVSAIRSFVEALLQSIVELASLDGNASADFLEGSQGLPYGDSISTDDPFDMKIAGSEPPKKMQQVPFKRVRAKLELQQLTSADQVSSEAETPSVDTTVDSIPRISFSSSKTLLGFSLPSKRGIMNKVDTRRKSVLTSSLVRSSIVKRDSVRDPSSHLSHSPSPSALLIEKSMKAPRATRTLRTTTRKSSRRVGGSSVKGPFADKSTRYEKKKATSVSSIVRDASSSRDDEDSDSCSSELFLGYRSSEDDNHEAAVLVDRRNDQHYTLDYQSSSFDDADGDTCSTEYVDILSSRSFSKDEDPEVFTSAHVLHDDIYDDADAFVVAEHPEDTIAQESVIPCLDFSEDPPVSASRKVDLVNQHQIRITSTAASRSLPSADTTVDELHDTIKQLEVHAANTGQTRSKTGVVPQKLFRVQTTAATQAVHRHRSKVSEHVLSHYKKHHIPYLSQANNSKSSALHSDNPLAGIWPYDPSLAAFNALLSLVKMRRRRAYARKRVWLKKKTFDRRKVGAKRVPYPLKYYRR